MLWEQGVYMYRNAFLLTLLLALPVAAQDAEESATEVTKATSAEGAEEGEVSEFTTPEKTDFITLRFDGQMATKYYFRGIRQEDQGVIGQPEVEIQLHLFQKSFVSDVYLFGRSWNSFHSGPTGSSSNGSNSPGSWYETRFTAGMGIKFCNTFTVSGGYTFYDSPNSRFNTVEELFIHGAVDDGKLWKSILSDPNVEFKGFRPYGLIAWETSGQRDNGRNRGVYAEVGINPGFTFKPNKEFQFSVSAPVSVGLNIFEYYEVPQKGDAPYGFTNVGLRGELPIGWLPKKFGSLTLYVQGNWYHLDQNLTRFNSRENDELVGSGGIRFEY